MLFHVGSFDYHAMASTDNESLLQLSLCREGCGCLDILPIALALILRQVTEVWRDLVLLRICCFCRNLHLRVERLLLRHDSDTHLMYTLRQVEEAWHRLLRLLRGFHQRYAIPVHVIGLRAVHVFDFLLFLLDHG